MIAVIEQGIITGTVVAPPSKSVTQRAYAAALLLRGTTIIHNAGRSDDEEAALRVIQQLGAAVTERTERTEHTITIHSNGLSPVAAIIDCGESGLATRLFTPIAALGSMPLTITGRASLLRRPMEGFAAILPALGVTLTGFSGYLPLSMQGPLKPQYIRVDGSGGSQLISGLLFAFAYSATAPVTIEVTGLTSTPYIDLTLDMLAHFGRPVKQLYYRRFIIDPTLFTHAPTIEINVEADWSSAAYLLVAGAIAGNVTVSNLNAGSRQADRAILDVLRAAGAVPEINDQNITVRYAPLRAFEFDATHSPDLFPILAILAACCEGESSIRGVHRLFYKESNRVESITQMLQDFAVHYSVEDDTLFITGSAHLQGTVIDSYGDHRIVMAAAIGALRARGRVDIAPAQVVNKSYPGFFEDLVKIGGKCGFVEDEDNLHDI